jgi:uncharacterized protein
VTNVANFGAFVDIGVHQDGLVHISMLSDKFVKDPREVVKAGQVVKVKVLEVDIKRQRVALTMRLSDKPPAGAAAGAARRDNAPRERDFQRNQAPRNAPAPAASPLAAAFAKAIGGQGSTGGKTR